MWEINSRIVGDEAQIPPTIKLERLKKYIFSTVNDGGSGAQSRGLIVFDLANLELSPLPFIVHDSDILDPIEKSTLTFIVKEYDSQKRTGLQVFAAFRSYEFFEEAVRDIISHNTVLELSAGGNELFGWAWNKKKTGEESGDMTVFSNMEEGDTIDE